MSASTGRRRGAFPAFLGLIGVSVLAGIMITVAVSPAIAVAGVGTSNTIGFFENLPSDLKIDPLLQKTELYAKNGSHDQLIAQFYTQNREVIPQSDITPIVRNATVAAEDIRFFQHGAIDPLGTARAAVQDALHSGGQQGGSTITQQYVKNVCIQEAERLGTKAEVQAAYDVCTGGVSRKIQEARYAIGVEQKYSKMQILTAYLNIVGFGGNVYGIESAAQYYYGVHAKDLTNAQAASLLAIVNDPSNLKLDVAANVPANQARTDYILNQEHTHHLISDADYAAATKSPIKPKITPSQTGCGQAGIAGFFCDYVTSIIQQDPMFGKTADDRYANLYTKGWKIYTTLDMQLQKTAQSTMNAHIPMHSSVGNVGSSAITVQVGTGRVLAMVQNKKFSYDGGGSDYTSVNYNTDKAHGGSSGFQPGSTYKLFTLLDWLNTGHTLNELVSGNERTIPENQFTACGAPYPATVGWPVGNDEGKAENGPTTVIHATAASINGAFASMGLKLDLCDIRKVAQAMGVVRADGTELLDVPPAIIGTNEVTPLSMATAYAGVANNGSTCSPVVIDKIVDTSGTDIPVPQSSCTQGVSKGVAIAAASALRSVVTGGTMYGDQTNDGIYDIGKTGTTDNAYDTWAIGGSSKTMTAVWVGSVSGFINQRTVYSFPDCPIYGSGPAGHQMAIQRHCLWKDIQTEANKLYGGAKTWAKPDSQYVVGKSVGVPNVVGQTTAAAQSILQAAGFSVTVGASVDSTSAKGTIAKQDPGAGASTTPGATVTVYPSTGTAPAPGSGSGSGSGGTPSPVGTKQPPGHRGKPVR